MPRDLTDLMELAVSSAPPETHLPRDITRVAVRAQQRRTAWVAASVAAAVVVVAGVTVGLVQGHSSSIEPVGPPHQAVHVSVTQAVPAASASGFSALDYGLPSVATQLGPTAPDGFGTYRDIDAQGRLLVMEVSASGGKTEVWNPTYEIVPGPGQAPVTVATPRPSAAPNVWVPSFTGDGGLAWQTSSAALDYLLADARGQHLVRVSNDLSAVSGPTPGATQPVRSIWYEDGRVWFSAVTRQNAASSLRPRQWVSLFSVDPAHPSALRAEKPRHAVEIALGGGQAVWLDGTTVKALDLATGAVRTVPVPIDSGCSLPDPGLFVDGSNPGLLATDGRLVSMIETCPSSRHLVVTDLDGRLVTDITSTSPGYLKAARVSGDLLTFEGDSSDGSISPYVDDLATGELVRLGTSRTPLVDDARANGRYVLWYDQDGGHVARFTG